MTTSVPTRAGARCRALAAMTVLLVLLAVPRPASAASKYFGALVAGQPPTEEALAPGGAITRFEQEAGKRMSLIQWGQPWKWNGEMQPFQRSYFENVRRHGAIPVLSWSSWELGRGLDQPDFQLRDITAGTYDAYLVEWARAARAWGHPFMLRFNHEMNGWWYPWGEGRTETGAIANGNLPGDFVKAWRHVHRIFVREQATNVTWLWNANIMAKNDRYPSLRTLYPGRHYVDWSGLSAYNSDISTWVSPTTMLTGRGTTWLRNSYRAVLRVAPHKPMMLAETGSRESNDDGARKAGWINNLIARALPRRFRKVRGFIWYDTSTAGYESLPIASSARAIFAFRRAVALPTYATNVFAGLSAASAIPGSPTLAARR